MMAQQQQQPPQTGIPMGAAVTGGGPFGDTTFTKVFVGGLAWETQRETMRRYFEQFGEILEAVVITDKNTGRSKGYGFVTFRDPEAARRACADPAPVIDGRRANCNLASLGARVSRPPIAYPGTGRFRPMRPPASPPQQPAYPISPTFPHQYGPYAYQQGFGYPQYGYPSYIPDYAAYQQGIYNPFGSPQFSPYYAGPPGSPTALYSYTGYAPPPLPAGGGGGGGGAGSGAGNYGQYMQYGIPSAAALHSSGGQHAAAHPSTSSTGGALRKQQRDEN